MCGILGSINLKEVSSYSHLIKHRGPDAHGSETLQNPDHTIYFNHRRLSIVDVSETGHQPMFSQNKNNCIIFNGEIYNHKELKKKISNTEFNGHSDTETIVNYFREYDIAENLSQLNGIFSFALFDNTKQQLYLARDRFGVKPLYYWFQNNQLLFSSEIRPLQAILDSKIDNESILNNLKLRYTPSPKTIYQNILKVEPGQLITFDLRKSISVRKIYFVSPSKNIGTIKKEYNKLVNEYGDLFEKAVERQMMADVDVGVLLSGGIDSALVAAIANNKSQKPIKGFTVGFKGDYKDIDEIDYAQQTAKQLGIEHYYKRIGFTDLLDSIKRISDIVEEPIGTTSIIPMCFLSELAASKVKVVLSGQGADESLGGYNKYKGLPLLEISRRFRFLMPLTKRLRFLYEKREKWRRLITSMQFNNDIDSFLAFIAIYSDQEILKLLSPEKKTLFRKVFNGQYGLFNRTWEKRAPDKVPIKSLFPYYDLRTSLSDDLLMYTDKITMHYSLECRVPILDNELIEFIESIDSRYKFNLKRGKIIHKEFARAYLPSSIIERKKMGFKSPTEDWFRTNYQTIKNMLYNKYFCDWFDYDAISKLLTQHYEGKNLEKQIFLLLNINNILVKHENLD